jgi:hypothetical protein
MRATMSAWRMAGEPSLDELLDDEIMHHVTRTAGLDTAELRRRLADLARRLDARTVMERLPGRLHSCGAGGFH